MTIPVVADEPSDAVLASRLRDGDRGAGELLVRRYHAPLMRYLHRLSGGDEHLAEELHQQTWLAVLDHLNRFQAAAGSGGFKAWLFRIATNKANDAFRSARRERKAGEALRWTEPTIATEVMQTGAMEQSEDQAKLLAAIDALPEAQRQIVVMRYYAGLKFIDIAAALGCPLNTALGRMHKAMLKLREVMV